MSKSDARVDAYGEVDELNASLGAVCASGVDADLATEIEKIQKELFAIGARLADPRSRIAERDEGRRRRRRRERLERLIDMLETEVPPLRRFILPGWLRARRVAASGSDRLPSRGAAYRRASGRTPSRRSSSCISTGCPICSS